MHWKRIVTAITQRPLPYALSIVGAYLITSDAYLIFTTELADHLTRSETGVVALTGIKAAIYFAMTAGGLVALAYPLVRRIAADRQAQVHNRSALVDAERRAIAGSLSLAVVHDCNNLLTIACGSAEMLLRRQQQLDARMVEDLRRLSTALNRLAQMSELLRLLARPDKAHARQRLDLATLSEQAVSLVRKHERVRQCEVALAAEPRVCAHVYVAMVHDLLANLLVNAAEACGAGGRIRVAVSRQDDAAVIEVHDDGPGIPPELRLRVFESFFTTKAQGSGLGLVSVRACVEAHGGRIVVGDSPLGGALFRVEFPAPQAARAPDAAPLIQPA